MYQLSRNAPMLIQNRRQLLPKVVPLATQRHLKRHSRSRRAWSVYYKRWRRLDWPLPTMQALIKQLQMGSSRSWFPCSKPGKIS